MKKKNYILLTTFLCVFSLASCDMSRFSEELTTNVLTALIPNFWSFLIQFLSFGVMMLVVVFFAYKPIKKFVDARREYMANEMKDAIKNNEESKANLDKSIEEIAKSKKEASKIIETAKNDAINEKKKIIASAEKEIDDMKDKAHKEVDNYKAQAEKEIKDQLIDLTIAASTKIIGREVNEEDNKRLVDEFINSIEEKH